MRGKLIRAGMLCLLAADVFVIWLSPSPVARVAAAISCVMLWAWFVFAPEPRP